MRPSICAVYVQLGGLKLLNLGEVALPGCVLDQPDATTSSMVMSFDPPYNSQPTLPR
jgi:hypothetical protein